MRVVSLGSGSSGNAVLVEAGPDRRTKLLVDAGFSTRVLTERLAHVGVQPSQLQGVLITHEHSDHVIGVPTLARRYDIPVTTDPRTYAAFEHNLQYGSWRTDSGPLAPLEAPTLLNVPQSTAINTSQSTVARRFIAPAPDDDITRSDKLGALQC